MKHLFLFSMLFLIGFSSCDKDDNTVEEIPVPVDYLSLERTQSIIDTLAGDATEGRGTSTRGFELASEYLVGEFQESGIVPLFSSYYDSLIIREKDAFNVVGINKPYDATKKTILIGAHLDHLGIRGNEEDSIFNGANDDASGVTAALQITQYLIQKEVDENVIIALFTGEELGLLGSRHLAAKLKQMNIIPSVVYNLEMLGTEYPNAPGSVYISGYELSNFAEVFNSVVEKDFILKFEEESNYNIFRRSDNYAFYQEMNIPSHTLITFQFENYDFYHKANDEIEKLDLVNMNLIIKNAAEGIYGILDQDLEIILN